MDISVNNLDFDFVLCFTRFYPSTFGVSSQVTYSSFCFRSHSRQWFLFCFFAQLRQTYSFLFGPLLSIVPTAEPLIHQSETSFDLNTNIKLAKVFFLENIYWIAEDTQRPHPIE